MKDIGLAWYISLTGIILVVTCVFSCTKEQDDMKPSVLVISPSSEILLSVPDSVLVIAEVTDNHIIVSIKVVLTNADRISVADPYLYYPDSTWFRLEQFIRATDKTLASGDYFILIYVSDGINTKSEYIPLKINEMPVELLGYVSVKGAGSQQTILSYLSITLDEDEVISFDEGYYASGINALDELFYLVTPEPSDIIAYSYGESEPEWTVQANLPYPVIQSIFVDHHLIAGSENGNLLELDRYGNVVVITTAELDKKVQEVSANEDFMVCEMVSLNGDDHYLYTYYRQTGGLNRNRKINGDIVSIIPVDKEFLVISTNGTGSDLNQLEPSEGLLTLLKRLPDEQVISATSVNSNPILINTPAEIYLYDYHFNTISFFAVADAAGLMFEAISSILFYYNDEGFGLISFPGGEDLGFYPSEWPVVDFHAMYNK